MNFPDINTPDGRLSGVVIDATSPSNRRDINVRPSLTATGAINRSPSDPEFAAKGFTAQVRLPNEADVIIGKLARPARLAERLSAMRNLIRIVLFGRGPAQIVEMIVGGVSIIVSALMGRRRGRADKSHKNGAVKQLSSHFAIGQISDVSVAEPNRTILAQPRPPIPGGFYISPKATKVADGVAVRSGNGLPNFARKCINIVSHGAVPSRVWSGPRGVTSTVCGPFSLAKLVTNYKGVGHALSVD